MGNCAAKEFQPDAGELITIDHLEYIERRNIEKAYKNLHKCIAQEWETAYPDMTR